MAVLRLPTSNEQRLSMGWATIVEITGAFSRSSYPMGQPSTNELGEKRPKIREKDGDKPVSGRYRHQDRGAAEHYA